MERKNLIPPKTVTLSEAPPSNLAFNMEPSQRAKVSKNVGISSLFHVCSIFSARMNMENYNIFKD